ncbi:hypothetical protein A3Q37_06793 [Streptomyces sp. PTY087I2]|nr:hypothetical protein A3Q37_06793 [Streptomyces sp. PTY087I2]
MSSTPPGVRGGAAYSVAEPRFTDSSEWSASRCSSAVPGTGSTRPASAVKCWATERSASPSPRSVPASSRSPSPTRSPALSADGTRSPSAPSRAVASAVGAAAPPPPWRARSTRVRNPSRSSRAWCRSASRASRRAGCSRPGKARSATRSSSARSRDSAHARYARFTGPSGRRCPWPRASRPATSTRSGSGSRASGVMSTGAPDPESSPANRVSASRQARSLTSAARSCSSSRTPGAATESGSFRRPSRTRTKTSGTDNRSTRTASEAGSSGSGRSRAVRAERRSPAHTRPVEEPRRVVGRTSRRSGRNASSPPAYEPGELPTSSTRILVSPTAR